MRADRLIALLLLLQTRPQVTAREVAEELEVSERTARRDLEALAMSGVPIYSTAGRGGGWRLLGGARTDLTGLSADEARSLFLAAGPALDSTPELKSAMRKLTNALPETFRADAEAASTAVKIDPSGWGQIAATTPRFLDALTDAVIAGHKVELDYVSPRSGPSRRTVSPLGLVTKRGIWYVVTNTRSGLRTFRLSRVRSVDPTDEPVDRPEGFDLEAAWEQIVGEVEAKRGELVVRILADPTMRGPLRYQFSGRIDIDDELITDHLGRERLAATIAEFGPAPLAGQLAGYGEAVEVIDPPEPLLLEFRRIARELADRWLADGDG